LTWIDPPWNVGRPFPSLFSTAALVSVIEAPCLAWRAMKSTPVTTVPPLMATCAPRDAFTPWAWLSEIVPPTI
jgi:hypothetical protein